MLSNADKSSKRLPGGVCCNPLCPILPHLRLLEVQRIFLGYYVYLSYYINFQDVPEYHLGLIWPATAAGGSQRKEEYTWWSRTMRGSNLEVLRWRKKKFHRRRTQLQGACWHHVLHVGIFADAVVSSSDKKVCEDRLDILWAIQPRIFFDYQGVKVLFLTSNTPHKIYL